MPPPRRRIRAQVPSRDLLVFVEGEVTEEQYFNYYQREHRETVHVEIHRFRGTPFSLVKKAVAEKKRNEREARRGRGRAHDEVWCVFDVDEHPDLKQAVSLASDHDIRLAISNPCIELWFLLHFQSQTAFIHRHDAQRAAKAHTGCDKALSQDALERLDSGYEIAKQRAQELDQKHRGDQTPLPDNNPSSGLWQVVDSMSEQPDPDA
jgi:hypothetical protein